MVTVWPEIATGMHAKILVVDDERAIADSLGEIIASAGYGVACAYSGAEAVAQAASFVPHILLTDVLMPDMNGFELALRVKEAFPSCRLVLFSGQAAAAQLAHDYVDIFARKGYQFELLPKPLHPEALLAKLADPLIQAV